MTRFKLIFSSIWGFVQPFLKMFLTKMGPIVLAAAVDAVKSVQGDNGDLSGSAKRALAFGAIEDTLKKQAVTVGTDVAVSMVNAAIEIAVAKMKAEG